LRANALSNFDWVTALEVDMDVAGTGEARGGSVLFVEAVEDGGTGELDPVGVAVDVQLVISTTSTKTKEANRALGRLGNWVIIEQGLQWKGQW